jgi:hypothetical protein
MGTLKQKTRLWQLREQMNKVEQVIVQQNTTAGGTLKQKTRLWQFREQLNKAQ